MKHAQVEAVRARPSVAPEANRMASGTFEIASATSPFSVADYVQMAGMGRRSAVLEIATVDGWGRIIIERGAIIWAMDAYGEGVAAFQRLLLAIDAEIVCRSFAAGDDQMRNMSGSCEELLLDAIRCFDESNRPASLAAPRCSIVPATLFATTSPPDLK